MLESPGEAIGRWIGAVVERIVDLNDAFAETVGKVLSISLFFTVLTIGTAIYFLMYWATHGKVDPGFTCFVMILTVQTALDTGATKLFQLSLRRADEKRDQQFATQLAAIADLTTSIQKELKRAEERDGETAARDAVLRKLVTRLLDAVEKPKAKGGKKTRER